MGIQSYDVAILLRNLIKARVTTLGNNVAIYGGAKPSGMPACGIRVNLSGDNRIFTGTADISVVAATPNEAATTAGQILDIVKDGFAGTANGRTITAQTQENGQGVPALEGGGAERHRITFSLRILLEAN